eukprot:COSAG02_NODE_14224_length_1295_cov_2.715208_2_plen_69_part_01
MAVGAARSDIKFKAAARVVARCVARAVTGGDDGLCICCSPGADQAVATNAAAGQVSVVVERERLRRRER